MVAEGQGAGEERSRRRQRREEGGSSRQHANSKRSPSYKGSEPSTSPRRGRDGVWDSSAPRRGKPVRSKQDAGGQERNRRDGKGTGTPPRRADRQEDRGRGSESRPRPDEPAIPLELTHVHLDKHIRGQLSTLSEENAATVAQHLVAAGAFLEEDPERAYRHAVAAQRRAGRMGVVREALGYAAYRTGRFEEALREFRTVRRLTGSEHTLPLMADCERGLGRPHRAVELLAGEAAGELEREAYLELLMVVAGARMDLGQPQAAALLLDVPELHREVPNRYAGVRSRLMSVYADALERAGETGAAAQWRKRAQALLPAELVHTDDDSGIVDLLDGQES